MPDIEELRRPLIAALAQLREVLTARPDRARAVISKLLAGRRLAVRADPDRGYVEGELRLEIERDPQGRGPGDLARQVAGGRYVTVEQTQIVTRRLRGSVMLAV